MFVHISNFFSLSIKCIVEEPGKSPTIDFTRSYCTSSKLSVLMWDTWANWVDNQAKKYPQKRWWCIPIQCIIQTNAFRRNPSIIPTRRHSSHCCVYASQRIDVCYLKWIRTNQIQQTARYLEFYRRWQIGLFLPANQSQEPTAHCQQGVT